MSDIFWKSAVNGDFTDAADWNPAQVPGAGDDANIIASAAFNYIVSSSISETVNVIHTGAKATLDIGGGVFTATNGTGGNRGIDAGANVGQIAVAAGAALEAGGQFVNSGILTLDGQGSDAVLRVAANNLTLTGGGMVSMSATGDNYIEGASASAVLDNVDNTISGEGSLGNGQLTLINGAAGVINGSAHQLVVDTLGQTLINNGLIEASAANSQGLAIVNTVVNNSGGGVLLAANSYLGIADSILIGGTLESSGAGGAIVTDGTSQTLDGTTSTVFIQGVVIVQKGSPLTIEGGITNTGTISVGFFGTPGALNCQDNPTLNGGGQVFLLANERSNLIDGTSLDNINNTISGAGIISVTSLVNENPGVIDADQSTPLFITSKGTVTNDGLLEANGGGQLVVTSTIDNAGTLSAHGGDVVIRGADIVGGTVQATGKSYVLSDGKGGVIDGRASAVTVGGNLIVANNTSLTLEGAIDNTGQVIVDSTSALTYLAVDATLTGRGQVVLKAGDSNSGVYAAGAGASLVNVDNRISGAGLLSADQVSNEAAGVIVGNTASELIVDAGPSTIANAGLILASGSGGVIVASAIDNTGVLQTYGGSLTVENTVTGAGRVLIRGGAADFQSAFDEAVVFVGGTGKLELGQSQGYHGTVVGFSNTGGTSFDLSDIGFVSSGEATFSGTSSGGTLTVTDGTHNAKIRMIGDYLSSTFTASSDGHGGTVVVDPQAVIGAPSVQRFVAAAAGLTGAAPAIAAMREAWRAPAPMLAGPRISLA